MNRSTRTLLRVAAVSPAAVVIAMACGPAHADDGPGSGLLNGPLQAPLNPLKGALPKPVGQLLQPKNQPTMTKPVIPPEYLPPFGEDGGWAERRGTPVPFDQLGQAAGLGHVGGLRSLTYSGLSAKCVTSASGSVQDVTNVDQGKLLKGGLGKVSPLAPNALPSVTVPPSKTPMGASLLPLPANSPVRFQSASGPAAGDPGMGFTFSKQITDPLGGMTDEALTVDGSTSAPHDMGLSHCAPTRVAQRGNGPGSALATQLQQWGKKLKGTAQVLVHSIRDGSGLPVHLPQQSAAKATKSDNADSAQALSDFPGLMNQPYFGRKAMVPADGSPLDGLLGGLTSGQTTKKAPVRGLPDMSGAPTAADGSDGTGSLGLPIGDSMKLPGLPLPGAAGPARLPMSAARRHTSLPADTGLPLASALPAGTSLPLDSALPSGTGLPLDSALPVDAVLPQLESQLPALPQQAGKAVLPPVPSQLPYGDLLTQASTQLPTVLQQVSHSALPALAPGKASPQLPTELPDLSQVASEVPQAAERISAMPGSLPVASTMGNGSMPILSNNPLGDALGSSPATGLPLTSSNQLGGLPGLSPGGLPQLPVSPLNG